MRVVVHDGLISRTSVDFPAPGGLSASVERVPAATVSHISSCVVAAASAAFTGPPLGASSRICWCVQGMSSTLDRW